MNTLANPHIARLRAAATPEPRFEAAGDACDRMGEDALAAAMAEASIAEREAAYRRDVQPARSAVQGSVEQTRERISRALSAGEADARTLSMRAGVSKSTVENYLHAMHGDGVVAYRRERVNKRHARHVWRLTRREGAG